MGVAHSGRATPIENTAAQQPYWALYLRKEMPFSPLMPAIARLMIAMIFSSLR